MKSNSLVTKIVGSLLFCILVLHPGFQAFGDPGKRWIPLSDPGAPPDGEPRLVISKSDMNDLNVDMITSGFYMTEKKENRETFQILELGEYHGDLDAGAPNLPTLRKHIYIPSGKTVQLRVYPGTPVVFNDVKVYPVQLPRMDSLDAVEPEFYIDESVYGSNQPLPSEAACIETGRSMRGHEIALLHICPFRYNPARESLEVYPRMKVRIHFDGPEAMMDQRVASTDFDNFIHGFILNPDSYGEYGRAVARGAEEGAELLIITGPDFATAADELSAHKASLGISTVVRTTDETGATKTEIQAYIQDAYDTWAPAPTYVLLLGDVETIPTTYETTSERGTDLYYTTVDGDDFTPDIFLGRISVDTLEEADVVVQKIIDYESNPPASDTFYANAALAAYFQDNDANGYADRRFVLTSEEIRDFMLTQGKSVERIYCRTENGVDPTNYNNGLYANGEPLPDELLISNGFAWDGAGADVSAAVDEGVFLLMHRDHGMDRNGGYGRTGWGDPYFTDLDVAALSNGALTPVVFSINCQSGWFDGETDHVTSRNYESFSELFLRKAGGGAVGVIGAVRNSYSGYNDALARGFIDCVWPDFLPSVPNNSGAVSRLGHILNHGKIAMDAILGDPWGLRQLEYELFHLFGDPTLEMWTQQPETQGTNTVRVQSSPELGVPVTVSLADINGLGDGAANFTRTYTSGDSVTLTAPGVFDGAGFLKWVVDGVDDPSLSVTMVMDEYHEAVAVYASVHTLSVGSSPVAGASITVAPNDSNGLGDGATDFTRRYETDSTVTLTAPATLGGREFVRWMVDGVEDTARTIQVTMDADYDAMAEYAILPGDRKILVIDLAETDASASAAWDAILANGYDVDYRTGIPASVNPELYMMVFVHLGVCPENHELTAAEGDVLMTYLDNGGSLYMEGGDTWAYDDPTSVHPYFGIDGLDDGEADTVVVSGHAGVFTEGISFTYEGSNDYMDRLGLAAGAEDAFAVWFNQSPRYYNGVARSTGVYKTIGVSFEFGGVPAAIRDDVMKKYLDFGMLTTLSVRSWPAAGVLISASPDDVNGAGSGESDFSRFHQQGETVTLIAPDLHGGRSFVRWTVDGVEFLDRTVEIVMDQERLAVAEYTISEEDISVLLIDLDGNGNSASEARDAITANGFNASYTASWPSEISLDLHPMVFVFLGIYDANHILSAGEGDLLAAYLDGGGSLYMEGGDTWFFDDRTTVHPYFGFEGIADGDGDTLEVSGASDSFTEGVSFLYEGENDYMDRLELNEGVTDASIIWNNTSPAYINGVARSTGVYKTIGVSFEFGGVPSGLQNDVMKRYLDFGHFYALSVSSSPVSGIALGIDPNDVYGDGGGNADFTRYYIAGEEVVLTAPEGPGGRHFIKWIVDGADHPTREVSLDMNEDHAAEAVYSELHSLTVQSTPVTGAFISASPGDVNGAGGGSSNFVRTYDDGTVVSLTAPEEFDDHVFIKWLVDGVERSDRMVSITMDGAHEASAVYSPLRSLTVQSLPSAGASISVSPGDVNGSGGGISNFIRSYIDGTEVSLTAPEEFDGLVFLKWLVDGVENSNRSISISMGAAREVSAVYSDLYTLTVQSTPVAGAFISASPEDVNGAGGGISNFTRIHTDGTEVSLTAPEEFDGRVFIRWLVDGVEIPNRTISVSMDAAHEVEAVYSEHYLLDVQTTPVEGASVSVSPVDVNGAGSGLSNFTRTYNDGAEVSLTVPDDFNGRVFSHWLVNGVENPNRTLSLVMDRAHEVTAVYSDPSTLYTLVVRSTPVEGASISVSPGDVNGESDGRSDFTRTYPDGAEVSLTAPTGLDGHVFSHWLVDDVENPSRTVSVLMDRAREASAVYSLSSPDGPVAAVGNGEYDSVQEAYDNASGQDELLCAAGAIPEDLIFDRGETVELRGGYSDDFTTKVGVTTVRGSIVVSNGAVVVESIVIAGP